MLKNTIISRKIMKFADKPKIGEYLAKTFSEINLRFEKHKRILDVGCGNGVYAKIFRDVFGLDTFGIDVYEHDDIKSIKGVKFKLGSIYDIKYKNGYFDYIFLHDVLHHIDEKDQSIDMHIKAMNELKRVVKKGGKIIIVEANRYNLLFYPHMVLMRKHAHWRQSYFRKIMKTSFPEDEYSTQMRVFESHYYPWGNRFWQLYENLIESLPIKKFHAYNLCIASKK